MTRVIAAETQQVGEGAAMREALSRRRIPIGVIGVVAVVLATVSLAWACVPQGAFNLSPSSGAAGMEVTALGNNFPPGPVEIRWGSREGTLLATATGPSFSVSVTIPSGLGPGVYYVSASPPEGGHGAHSATAAAFTVTDGSTGSPSPPAAGQQNPSPLIDAALPALTGKTIKGTSRSETLRGTPFADVIDCGAGNDRVSGGGGNDVINCGAGRDRVDGGAGNDRIDGASGNDKLSGGSGYDRVCGGPGNDRLSGASGNDRLLGGAGNDILKGNAGKDRLYGNGGADVLFRGGTDRLFGGSGKNRIID